MSRKVSMLVLSILVVIGIYGCGRSHTVANDPTSARDLLEHVYSGSVSPMEAEVDSDFLRFNPDSMLSRTAIALRSQFGDFRDLELKSSEKGPMGSSESVWTVKAERTDFQMKISVNSQDKIVGLWFWSPSLQDWVPSHVFGLDNQDIKRYLGGMKR